MAGTTKNVLTGAKSFVLFGLNEKRILSDARQVKADAAKGKIGYTLASKTQNCAAMASRMLRSGGSENFAKFQSTWISDGPNNVHAYAKLVQAQVDELNKKLNNIDAKFSASLQDPKFRDQFAVIKKIALKPTQLEISDLKQQQQKIRDLNGKMQLDSEIKTRLSMQTSAISRLVKEGEGDRSRVARAAHTALVANTPKASDDFDSLTSKAKNMVLAMDAFLEKTAELSGDQDVGTLMLGRTMLDRTRELMKIAA